MGLGTTTWGSAVIDGQNGMRLGWRIDQSGGPSSFGLRLRIWVWTRRSVFDSSNSFSVSGNWPSRSGSVSISHSSSSEWSTSNRTLIYDESISASAGQIRSFSASLSGVSAVSGTASVSGSRTLPSAGVPSAPGRPTVSAVGGDRVTVTFGAPSSDGGAPITNHQFQFATDSNFNNQHSAPQFTGGRTYTETGLSAGTTYWVRARVQNMHGWGSWSASRSFTTTLLAPNPPSNVQGERVSDAAIEITWSRHPTSDRPWHAVHVERRHVQSDGSWASWIRRASSGLGSATSYSDSTVANRRFEHRVRSSNSAGVSEWVSTGTIDTTPAPPSNVQAQDSSAGITLTWVNEARMPTRVRIEHQASGGPWEDLGSLSDANTSWTHAEPVGFNHRYRLRAETLSNPTLLSDWAESNLVGVAAPPSAPTNLGPASSWDATEDRVFTWRHVPVDTSGQESFQVRHRLHGGTWTTEPQEQSGDSRWTLPAGTYANADVVEWQVRTWGAHPDPSPWSATQATSPIARPTVAITTPEHGVEHGMSSVTLQWGFDQAQGLPQAAWQWELSADGQVVQERSGTGPRATAEIGDLLDEVTYAVRVRVASGGLWSVWDESIFPVSYLPPRTPEASVSWDVDLGAAVISITQPQWDEEFAEPDYHQVWRAIGSGRWVMIADRVPLGSSVTDPIPAIGEGTVNHYRATTVSILPSVAHSDEAPLAVTVRDTRGWVYLNGGPGMATVCRVKANAARDDSEGIDGTVEHQAGRRKGVIQSGDVELLDWSVSARIAPDYEGASTRAELVELQKGQAGGSPICYRDPTGHARWFGFMGRPSFSHRSILGEVSWSMIEAEFNEGLAFAAADEVEQ